MCVWTITDLWRSKWGNVRLTGNFLQYLFWVIQTHQLTGGENRRKELQSNHTTNGGAGKKETGQLSGSVAAVSEAGVSGSWGEDLPLSNT